MDLRVDIDAELADKVRLGLLALEGVAVRVADEGLAAAVDAACTALCSRHAHVPSGQVPGVEEARRLYRAFGIDPTKTRPSNEALLRRALKGEPLYRINTLVDALNLCSLEQQLPYGLYDLSRVVPPVVLRRGRPGEGYEGIRKGFVSVAGRLVLVDGVGPFGNPTSDSARTSIDVTARDVLVVAFAPRACPLARLERALLETEALLLRHNGGRCVGRRLERPEP